MNQITSRTQALRLALRHRFGREYDRRACARRAGIAERAWAGYERGENMPPVDAALAIARVLGVTVEQLAFRRRPPERLDLRWGLPAQRVNRDTG